VKGVRIVQLILVLLVGAYLWLFHSANPVLVELPLTRTFLPQLPVGFVVIATLLIGWLIGFLPGRVVLWRRNRDLRKATQELAAAQQREATSMKQTGTYYPAPSVPVIPDRAYDPEADAEPDPDEAA